MSRADLAALVSHPPSLGQQDGDAEGCIPPARARDLSPAVRPATAVSPEKSKKLSKINAGGVSGEVGAATSSGGKA